MFEWGTAIAQVVFIGIIILIVFGLFKFVKGILQHFTNSRLSLKRIEEKLNDLTEEKEKHMK